MGDKIGADNVGQESAATLHESNDVIACLFVRELVNALVIFSHVRDIEVDTGVANLANTVRGAGVDKLLPESTNIGCT